jgi:hypothetical protein
VLEDELGDARVDDAQAIGQWPARSGDAPLSHDGEAFVGAVDDAEPGAQRAGIEAEDPAVTAR